MKVLCIGDVVGVSGQRMLRRQLPRLRKKYAPQAVIVNGENAADKNGIFPPDADNLFNCGVDVVTGGNHSLQQEYIHRYYETHPRLLRPVNQPDCCPGNGVYTLDFGATRLAVVSLMGQAFFQNPPDSPFAALEKVLQEVDTPLVVVDFHAEATGEKLTLAHAFDGRVSAIVGTHTHVPTADPQILPHGTGYITDLGMTGPSCSVLGVRPECTLRRMRDHLPTRFTVADTPPVLQGVALELDESTGLCTNIEQILINDR